MVMLTAYIDESGYGAKDVIVLAGFVGNDQQWALCSEKWKSGLGKRRALHMKSLRWKNQKRIKPLLEKLGKIPHECGLNPVWVRLKVSDYADLVEDTFVSKKLQHGYLMGAQLLGLILIGFAALRSERIKIVFEYNEHFAPIVPTLLKFYGTVFPWPFRFQR